MKIEISDFGVVNGCKVQLFKLSNSNGIVIKLTNYGGIVTSIETPDKQGLSKNIVLGFDNLEDYLSDQYLSSYPYFGCVIGRVGNRIANGTFELDGVQHQVSKNKETFQLHGGNIGFDRVVWKATSYKNENEVGVVLNYLSVDGEEGFPGNLNVSVTYALNNENEFSIVYKAETDKATPVNMTQHTYFNLGEEKDIKNHQLQINSLEITETDTESIPTGNMLPVHNSPFDFSTKKKIGRDFDMLELGYDNNYGLANDHGDFIKAGELSEEVSGRVLEIFTSEVGMQLYTGAFNPELEINGVKKFGQYSGVALETQHYPNAVNQNNFVSTILRPGEKYNQKTVYKFSVQEH